MPEPHIVNMNAHLRVQWGKNQRHWSTEVWYKVIWTDESFYTMFWTRGRLHVEQTGLNARPLLIQWGGSSVCCHGLDPLSPIEGGVPGNANEYKVVLVDHLYSTITFCHDGSGFFQDDRRGQLIGEKMMWMVCNSLLLTRSQPRWTPGGGFGRRCTVHHHH